MPVADTTRDTAPGAPGRGATAATGADVPTEDAATGVGASARGSSAGGGAGAGGGVRRWVARHRWWTALAVLAVVGVGVLAWLVTWYEGEVGGGPRGPRTIVDVAQGASVSDVTASLARRGVVGSSLAFHIYLLLHGTPTVQPGGYLLYRREGFAQVRAELASGPDVFPVTLPAGFTEFETAERVAQLPGHSVASFTAAAAQVHSPYQPAGSTNLDGLLGTGTYIVVPHESDTSLVQQMVDRFVALANSSGLTARAEALGITPYQAVTVASIVQKEGVYAQNVGKVARVVYNRLARGMPLQMNSTVLYSEHRDGGPVTSSDLALNTPYNTYLHTGLTPTPICFPSAASLAAALAPPPGGWLYFVVVSNDGTEAFSDTLAGQEANEQLAKSRGVG